MFYETKKPYFIKDDSVTLYNRLNSNEYLIKTKSFYLSQLFNELPKNCILNKALPGVGLTSFIQQNDQNLIIIGPYKKYLTIVKENAKDILVIKPETSIEKVKKYINLTKVLKIVTTIDTFWKCESLIQFMDVIVVDEYHSVLNSYMITDRISNLNASFRLLLENAQKTCFTSATPVNYTFSFMKSMSSIRIQFPYSFHYNDLNSLNLI